MWLAGLTDQGGYVGVYRQWNVRRLRIRLTLCAVLVLAVPVCAVANSGTYTGSGGVFTTSSVLGGDISVQGLPLSGTTATLSFSCLITAYGGGTYQINWNCAGGSINIASPDNSLILNGIIVSASMSLTASGGGKDNPTKYLYFFTGTFSGTITVGGSTQNVSGPLVLSVHTTAPVGPSGVSVSSLSLTWNSDLTTLTVFDVGAGAGTITSIDGQINCGTVCLGSYNLGSPVTLTATASQGSTFDGWTGCDSSSGDVCNLTTNSARRVTASFGSSSLGLRFVPVPPCRVADTRNLAGPLGGPAMAGDSSRDFPILQSSCGIPATATAYSLNFTVVPQHILGYLTVWPSGNARPMVSTLNALSGAITANAAIVPAGTAGNISVYVTDTTDVVADINGYFGPPGPGGQSLYAAAPCRVLDTRTNTGAFQGVLTVNVTSAPCAIP